MTETIVGVIGDRPGDKRRWPSIGRVGMGYEAQIRDAQGLEMPTGKVGEMWVKGIPAKRYLKSITNYRRKVPKRLPQKDGCAPVIMAMLMKKVSFILSSAVAT